MEVILLKSIERLGAVGDVVDVRDGFARNWLLPQRFALEATPENMLQLKYRKRKLLAQEAETFQKLQAVAAEVAKQSVTLMALANEEDHLFGSVGPREIAKAFSQENIELEPRMVLLDEPIKELGAYNVRIRLHPDIEVTTKVWVVRADEGEAHVASDELAAEADEERAEEDEEDEEGRRGERTKE